MATAIPLTATATVTATGTTASAPGNGPFPGFPDPARFSSRRVFVAPPTDSCRRRVPRPRHGFRSGAGPRGPLQSERRFSPIFRRSCVCHVVLVGRATRFDTFDRKPNLNPTKRDEHERLQENPRRYRRRSPRSAQPASPPPRPPPMVTAMVTARMAGMATIAIPRTAPAMATANPRTATATAIPRTATATAMATATATGNGRFPGFPSTDI